MPAHAIGVGTCNLGVNLPSAERAVWGRLAWEEDRSISAFIREKALAGLAKTHPQEAAKILAIRRSRRALAMAAIFAVSLAVNCFEGGFDVLRRANRQTARVQFAPRRTDTQLL